MRAVKCQACDSEYGPFVIYGWLEMKAVIYTCEKQQAGNECEMVMSRFNDRVSLGLAETLKKNEVEVWIVMHT